MKTLNKLLLLLIVVFSTNAALAQDPTDPPPNPGGGGGGTTPGSQSIPVDMYVYVLAIIAIMLIVFYTKKYKAQKI